MTEEPEIVEGELSEEEAPQLDAATQLTEARVKEMITQARADGKAEAEETFKGFQRTVSKTQRENEELRQRLEAAPAPPASTVTQELMLQELKQLDSENADANPRIALLEQQIALEKRKAQQTVAYNQQQAEARTEKGKLETQIEEAGFDPNHEDFEDVF